MNMMDRGYTTDREASNKAHVPHHHHCHQAIIAVAKEILIRASQRQHKWRSGGEDTLRETRTMGIDMFEETSHNLLDMAFINRLPARVPHQRQEMKQGV